MTKFFNSLAIVFISILALAGCGSKESTKDNSAMLPQARGASGEIILVMDSAKWAGPVGEEIKKIFREPMAGLPQTEPLFTLRHVDPLKLNSVLKNAKNLIFVTLLNDNSRANRKLKGNFTPASIEKIKNDTSLFMLPRQNQFARGQEVLHLFGNSDELLIQKLQDNKSKIQTYFHNIEKKRFAESLLKTKGEKGIQKNLLKKHQFEIHLPLGYEIAEEGNQFVWLRFLDPEVDRSILISYKDYSNENIFEDKKIIEWRAQITQSYVFGNPDNPESYMITEPLIPVVHTQTNFNNKFAVESRGLWKTNNQTMGGPFLSYVFVDKSLNRVYYLEGFLYAPGKNKRDYMRELETVLWSFKTQDDLQPKL
jgi:hypothetical protein